MIMTGHAMTAHIKTGHAVIAHAMTAYRNRVCHERLCYMASFIKSQRLSSSIKLANDCIIYLSYCLKWSSTLYDSSLKLMIIVTVSYVSALW
jgi:hypothetical protein